MPITVESFMTRNPRCIEASTPVGEAYRLMRQLDVRHLPVLLDERIAGLLSQRELLRLEAQASIDRSQAPVSDAMTLDPYVVEPGAHVAQVAAEMSARKLGSAIVADKNRVVGIFTTSDALQAFASLLRRSVMEDRRATIRSAGIID